LIPPTRVSGPDASAARGRVCLETTDELVAGIVARTSKDSNAAVRTRLIN